ncbi:aminotransferase class I/II-fold pyridoxal phosphate-dependent enzyme [Gammaproteobacteria bacterium AB-CW1]|uniref:Aminotransferase n=1 Tax=Natronospira elongata TaxID=3110268 RepID=A0AAP6JGN1_9GAMM|nr:aminotransferase class I/II-fold pyridoxal phosphate-dependent enzyme [Gammaproteobacteria bacterium AB-CW1]
MAIKAERTDRTGLERVRSDRVASLVQSDIRAMTQRCLELDGVNLGQGICDTPPPELLAGAVAPAIERGDNRYTRYDGIGRLRHALADRLQRHNGLDVDPDGEIVVTIGSTGAFATTVMALCNPGDAIILIEPYYGYHLNTARVAGLETRLVGLRPDDFSLDMAALEEAAKGARALVLNTPGNPSGRVFNRRELEQLGELCQRHDLLCITDEIYEYFLFDGHRHISPATLPSLRDRTVTISGYSKTYSITGWRIGFLTAPRDMAQAIGLVNDLFYVCAPSPLQAAVAETIKALGDDYYQGLAHGFQLKRDDFCGVLNDIGLTPRIPEGAYYVLADVTPLGKSSSQAAAMEILEQAGVASVPGSAFFSGDEGESVVRFCFGKSDQTLHAAQERLLRWGRAGA